MNTEKLTIGVMPRFIWIEKRMEELTEACSRRLSANQYIPKEWEEEYKLLESELKCVEKVGSKTMRLTVHLNNDTTIFTQGSDHLYQVESVQMQLDKGQDIIMFGYIGVRREMINYFVYEEVK